MQIAERFSVTRVRCDVPELLGQDHLGNRAIQTDEPVEKRDYYGPVPNSPVVIRKVETRLPLSTHSHTKQA